MRRSSRLVSSVAVALALLVVPHPRAAAQGPPAPGESPRDVVVAWLLAPTMDDALKYLLESTAQHWKRMRALFADTPATREVLSQIELSTISRISGLNC